MASADIREEQSFKRMWIDAQIRFEDITGQKLMQSKNRSLDDVYLFLDKHFNAQDSESSGKKKRIKDVVFNVLGFVQLLCGIAAQGVSAVFGPATLCFNAVQALINIPTKIDKFYDDLAHLFEEVSAFMKQFKIYQRIEQYAEVDIELKQCTTKVIIVFVDICALSIDILSGSKMKKFKTLAKIALFDNDSGVRDKLEEMERLIIHQGQISDAITLEHVLRSEKETTSSLKAVSSLLIETSEASRMLLEEKSDEILSELAANRNTLQAVEAGMEALQKDTTKKNSEREQQELFKDLCKKLLVDRDRIQKSDAKDFDQMRSDSLPDTGNWLKDVEAYKEWIDLQSVVETPLLLTGSNGSGKSHLAFAALDDLKRRYSVASSNQTRVLVAFYRFTKVNDETLSRDGIVKEALRIMAAQIADKNTAFSKHLNSHLESKDPSFLKDVPVKDLPKALIPPPVMKDTKNIAYVLLFDGVDQLSGDLANQLFEAILAMKSTNIRILLTETERNTPSGSNFAGGALDAVKSIRVAEFNEVDIKRFIGQELEACRELQRKEPEILRIVEAIKERLPEVVGGNFSDVRRIFDTVVRAFKSMSSEETIIGLISKDTLKNKDTETERSVVELQESLIDQEIEQLNEILIWTIYAFEYITVDDMRAILTLRDKKPPLQRLDDKVAQRYSQLLQINPDTNYFEMRNSDLEQFFQNSQRKDTKNDSDGSLDPRISMTIKVDGVKLSKVQRFLWDLSERVVLDKFTFTSSLTDLAQNVTIHANKTDAHLTIARRCFDLLLDEPKDETEAIDRYAPMKVMWHLKMLIDDVNEGLLQTVEREEIVDGLVSLLQYPEYLEKHLTLEFLCDASWVSDYELDAIHAWLLDSDARGKLDRKRRKWLTQVVMEDKPLVLKDIATMIARQWLCYRTWVAEAPFQWLNAFLELSAKAARDRTANEDRGNSNSPVSSNGEHSDAYSHTEPPERDMSIHACISRATEWVESELKITKDSLWYQRVGDTYSCYDETEHSIEVFLKAKELPNDSWKVSESLANAYAANEKLDLALQEIESVLSHLRGKEERTADETNDLVRNLIQAAQWQVGNTTGSIEKLREAIGLDDNNYHSHYELLKVFIQTGQESEALKLLKDMNTNSAKDGNITQLEAMLVGFPQWDDPLICFEKVFYVVREQDMFHTVLKIMEKALTSARETKAKANLSDLLLCQGVALARYSSEEKRHEAALKHWTESYLLGFECGQEYTARSAARYAFNVYFSETRSDRDAARESETMLVERVEKLASSTSSPYYAPGLRLRLGSYYSMLGRQEAAQKLLVNDMRNGMDLLADEDPENDWMGYSAIADILMHTGDDLNALSAWSLYGPSERRKEYDAKGTNEDTEAEIKTTEADGEAQDTGEVGEGEIKTTDADEEGEHPRENREAKEAQEDGEARGTNGDAGPNGAKENGETSHTEESAELPTQSEASPSKLKSSSDEDAVDFFISCDGQCNKSLTWASHLWKCKVCDDVDFEDECLEKLKLGQLTRYVCSPDHEWLYVPSWVEEYQVTGKGRVRVGGELVDGRRVGGQIVPVSEFLDMIREKWGIEKPGSSDQNEDEKSKEEEVHDGEAAS